MSIFNVPVDLKISGSLALRQTLMGKQNRTTNELAFLNSNTSWVKLSSSVNIGIKGDSDARANVLAGGTLALNQPKFGVGTSSGKAYSLKNSDGSTNEYGIRPMPGITSVSVDNIGAYGSIRKAIVNFQCWDIQQLELLEQLYMRPGYTVLLEYGRNTYLNDKGNLELVQSQTNFFTLQNINLQNYLNKLYKDSLDRGGNYDAFFGYITNYSWSARDDGGYDCKTEILSTGEILESIKVNYSGGGEIDFSKLGLNTNLQQFKGFLFPTFPSSTVKNQDITRLNEEYSANALGGLISELWLLCRYGWRENMGGSKSTQQLDLGVKYGKIDYMHMFYKSPSQSSSEIKFLYASSDNFFITLESFANLFTKLILPNSTSGKTTGDLVGFSTKDRSYLGKGSQDLLCLFNTYMTSTNPDVCVIKSPQWAKILSSITTSFEQTAPISTNVLNDPDITDAFKTKIANWVRRLVTSSSEASKGSALIYGLAAKQTLVDINNDFIASKLTLNNYLLKFNKNYQSVRGGEEKGETTVIIPANPGSVNTLLGTFTSPTPERIEKKLYSLRTWIGYRSQFYGNNDTHQDWIEEKRILRRFFTNNETFGNFMKDGGDFITGGGDLATLLLKLQDPSLLNTVLDAALQAQIDIIIDATNAAATAAATSTTLKEISAIYETHISQCKLPFKFPPDTKEVAYGNTSNIYVNLKFLYKLATDSTLMSQDSNGKNSLSAMSFLTPMARGIQTALGNVNNFAIHIDPIDGIARMIDINYINRDGIKNLFSFEIGSNKSIVRNLNLESQIFSDQSSMVAISAQSDAGRLGLDNSTLVSYNKGITDRMIAKKDSPLTNIRSKTSDEQLNNFISSLAIIANRYLKPLFQPNSDLRTFNVSEADLYSNSLRDVINFITSVKKSDNKDKGFIPTQISLTIDGIAGWVIGNLFKVDETFIPQYYKRTGGKSGYIVTKIGHQIENNSWTTTIKGYPFNLDNDVTESDDGNFNFTIVVGYNPNNVSQSGPGPIIVNIKAAKNRQTAYDNAEAANPGFKAKVRQVAAAIGANEDDLLKIMFIESAGTLNPAKDNGIGCVGLIQFCPDRGQKIIKTIGGKKYNISDLAKMDRIRQMDVVQEYFNALGFKGNKPLSLTTMYLSTFYPVAVGKPGNWVLGSEDKDPNYKFEVASDNSLIAAESTVFIDGKKVINVDAVTRFISK